MMDTLKGYRNSLAMHSATQVGRMKFVVNRSNEAVHVNRNMAMETPDMEDQEQQKDYDLAAEGITQN